MKPFFVLDMDEALCGFVEAACAVHNRPVESVTTWFFYTEVWNMTSDEFWGKIHACGDSFYGEMVKPKPWAFELLDRVKSLGDYVIMTSPGIGKPADYSAKRIWIDKHVPGAKLIVGSEKHLLSAPGRMLIDDNEATCDKFEEYGGRSCLIPFAWNRHRDKVGERLHFVGQNIDKFVRELN